MLKVATPPANMTPGAYLALCRTAAGLTASQLAMATVSSPVDLSAATVEIEEAEADRALLSVADLLRFQPALHLVPGIYTALAYGLPHRPFCRRCGSACDRAGTDDGETMCPACSRKPS